MATVAKFFWIRANLLLNDMQSVKKSIWFQWTNKCTELNHFIFSLPFSGAIYEIFTSVICLLSLIFTTVHKTAFSRWLNRYKRKVINKGKKIPYVVQFYIYHEIVNGIGCSYCCGFGELWTFVLFIQLFVKIVKNNT